MEKLAHISEDGRRQTILEHLEGTAELCSSFAEEFDAGKLGYYTGILHDIGKYSEKFQKRIHGSNVQVDHSTAGAKESGNMPVAFCISGHHSGLLDIGGQGDNQDKATLYGRFKKKLEDYSDWRKDVTQEIKLEKKDIPEFFKDLRNYPFSCCFSTRMLYSCLVDADFLDTERFMLNRSRESLSEYNFDLLNQKLDRYTEGWFPPVGSLNERRCDILTQCLKKGEEFDSGLYSLTVPTGGGKTVSSLAFALRHAKAHGKKRIIYVIPYTSIIEQNAEVFRNILGSDAVLEHHSNVEFGNQEENDDGYKYVLASENWDAEVIVTTAVQFFESLYANRSSKCRKLHNIVNSVIIFDEAQMMPISYLKPCVWAIAELIIHYGCTGILCTATQPALNDLFNKAEISDSIKLSPKEIYESKIDDQTVFSRARYQLIDGKLSWEELADRIGLEDQSLCIVNSRKNAKKLFDLLSEQGFENIYHLSTLMYPEHRNDVFQKIKAHLRNGESCKVVSTSLIEAGVDIDFPTVFREINGLDSILQAGGRCNREGKRDTDSSFVYIFESEDTPPPAFETPISATRQIISRFGDEGLSTSAAIEMYFNKLLYLKGEEALDREKILKLISDKIYPFKTVAENFKLIDDNTSTVYIPFQNSRGEANECEEYLETVAEGRTSRNLFRKMGLFSVSIYPHHKEKLLETDDIRALEGTDSYVLVNPELYSEETGLSLTAEEGKSFFI